MDYRMIKEALEYGARHPVPLLAEARESRRWETVRSHPYFRDALEEVRETARTLAERPISALPYSLYRLFDETGSRKEYEQEYFARRQRLNAFALLSVTDGDERCLSLLEDAVWAICDEYTWCLPAHLGGTSTQLVAAQGPLEPQGAAGTALRDHRRWIDLFAAETAFALAEIVALLGDRLSPLVVQRAKREVLERVLEPYASLSPGFHWETVTMNWSAVCAAGIGAAALHLIPDTRTLLPVVHRLLGAMDSFLAGFAEDGACTEGIGYWNYGFGFFVYFAELLRERTAGRIDLLGLEPIRRIALFQEKCFLSGEATISFSDAGLTGRFEPGLTHRLKSRFPELHVPETRLRSRFGDDHCYRWGHFIRSFLWSDPELAGAPWPNRYYYLPDAQWVISRFGSPAGQICFAAKGGHNGEPHNQNDVGSFLLHANGETLLADIGAGEYTKQYFGPQRYSFLCNGSQGHSVPIVDGVHQSEGSSRAARVVDVRSTDELDLFRLELSAAYPHDGLGSLVRAFTLEKQGRARLRLSDEYRLDREPASFVERFVTFHPPAVDGPGRIVIAGEKAAVHLTFDPDALKASIGRHDFVNHQKRSVNVYTVDLTLKQPAAEAKIDVAFEIVRR